MVNSVLQFFKASTSISTSSVASLFSEKGFLSHDVIVLVVLFILFFIYGMYFGKSRLVSLLLAFYPAMLLFKIFPFLDKLMFLKGEKGIVANQVIIFLLFLILLDILINRFIFSESVGGSAHFLHIAGYALSAIILVLLFSHTTINLDIFYNFSLSIDMWFATPIKIFVWYIVSLGLLFVF